MANLGWGAGGLQALEESKMNQYRQFYQTYLDNFNEYFKANNIETPSFNSVAKRKWFSNLFKPK